MPDTLRDKQIGIAIRFVKNLVAVAEKRSRVRLTLWWSNQWQAFGIRTVVGRSVRHDIVFADDIEKFLNKYPGIDRRQKGRAIRRARRILNRLIVQPRYVGTIHG